VSDTTPMNAQALYAHLQERKAQANHRRRRVEAMPEGGRRGGITLVERERRLNTLAGRVYTLDQLAEHVAPFLGDGSGDDVILRLRRSLSTMVTGWRKDVYAWHRSDGLGDLRLAEIDQHCGGYQDHRRPVMIGWRVRGQGTTSYSSGQGLVMVDAPADADDWTPEAVKAWEVAVDVAIEEAKVQADVALAAILKDRPLKPVRV